MKTCVVTATYGCAPNKVWLYMTNPTLNSWNPTVASAEVDLEGMHIVEKNKVLVCSPSRRKSWKSIWKPCAKYWVTKPESDSQYLW